MNTNKRKQSSPVTSPISEKKRKDSSKAILSPKKFARKIRVLKKTPEKVRFKVPKFETVFVVKNKQYVNARKGKNKEILGHYSSFKEAHEFGIKFLKEKGYDKEFIEDQDDYISAGIDFRGGHAADYGETFDVIKIKKIRRKYQYRSVYGEKKLHEKKGIELYQVEVEEEGPNYDINKKTNRFILATYFSYEQAHRFGLAFLKKSFLKREIKDEGSIVVGIGGEKKMDIGIDEVKTVTIKRKFVNYY